MANTKDGEPIPDDAQSIKQIADVLEIRPIRICDWIEAGKLKYYVRASGGALLVGLKDVLRLVNLETPRPKEVEPVEPLPDSLDNLIPSDLISIKEAARLVKNTHVNTIRRWIHKGKLQAYKLTGERFLVSRADVLNLIRPHVEHKPELPPTRREMTKRQEYVARRLKELKVT
jgi:excisionase family DNA binding protein